MKHLSTLKTLNTLFAVLFYLIGLACLVGVSILGILAIGDDLAAGLIMIGAGVFGGLICIVFGVVYQITGKRLVAGKGRILQSILAVLNITNVPLGTIYALFALYVCWMNEEAKEYFEETAAGG